MTEGEKMIWAAEFVGQMRDYRAQRDRVGADSVLSESEAMHGAAEHAAGVVEMLREERRKIVAGFGKGSDVARFISDMCSK